MQDGVSEELRIFRESFRKWLEAEIIPHHEEWEKAGIVPPAVYRSAGAQGFLCMTLPEKFGGLGLDFRYSAVVIEEMGRARASGIPIFLHSDIIVPYIDKYGTEEQKGRWLPKLASGELISAIAMTEPGTGSDLQGISTRAVKKGSDWILNGSKTFVSNGHVASLVIVVAETEKRDPKQKYKSLTLFVVEEGMEGFERGRRLDKMGLKAQDTAEMTFKDCHIPAANRLGDEGKAFTYLTSELAQERLCVAIWCVALARSCLEWTVRYTKERHAFGKLLFDLQNTRFKLAEMATEVELGQAFVDRCIAGHVSGRDMTKDASMAKYWCSEMLGRVADEGVQLFGGYGFMMEYPISRAYLDARVQRIFAGTTEIMKEIIARNL
jgi:alkylation response protein AidB-like acyl-CoA dehydrogenase